MFIITTAFYALCIAITNSECLHPSFILSSTTNHTTDQDANVTTPLLLTPLIKLGRISEARMRSEVLLMPQIKGNAGFLTVNESWNSNIYFWLCKQSSGNWTKAPLILWLEGGPGCSSIFSLFVENGPFFVRETGLHQRKNAWTSHYNVLYVDQPVGTGFSFTDYDNGYISSQAEVALHLYEALTQFYQIFPELRNNALYITGESYAGKYIPAISNMIHHRNLESNSTQMPLKGMFIGSGWFDPVNMLGYAEHLHRLGLIDFKQKREMEVIEERIVALVRSGAWLDAEMLSGDLHSAIYRALKFDSPHDYTQNEYTFDTFFVQYLEKEKVRRSIHVGQRNFEICSIKVYEHFKVDIMKSVKPWIEELLEHYPIVFYSGQLDILVAYPQSENFIQKLQWSGAKEYSMARRRILRAGRNIVGYYKTAGNLVDVLVRNAGHLVARDQPKYTLDLLVKFVEGTLT